MPINRSGSINEDFKEIRRTNANLEKKSQSLHSTSGNLIFLFQTTRIFQNSTELENIYCEIGRVKKCDLIILDNSIRWDIFSCGWCFKILKKEKSNLYIFEKWFIQFVGKWKKAKFDKKIQFYLAPLWCAPGLSKLEGGPIFITTKILLPPPPQIFRPSYVPVLYANSDKE